MWKCSFFEAGVLALVLVCALPSVAAADSKVTYQVSAAPNATALAVQRLAENCKPGKIDVTFPSAVHSAKFESDSVTNLSSGCRFEVVYLGIQDPLPSMQQMMIAIPAEPRLGGQLRVAEEDIASDFGPEKVNFFIGVASTECAENHLFYDGTIVPDVTFKVTDGVCLAPYVGPAIHERFASVHRGADSHIPVSAYASVAAARAALDGSNHGIVEPIPHGWNAISNMPTSPAPK